MRKISIKQIDSLVKKLIFTANFNLPLKVQKKLKNLHKTEKQALAKNTLKQITENFSLAAKEQLPLCQDTGVGIFFVKIGHQVLLEEPLQKTLDKALKKYYQEFYLRKSTLIEPLFNRKNTFDNLPAFLHLQQIEGNKLEITFMPKGGGAENKSALTMLSPSDGQKGIIDFVIKTVKKAGGSACPPLLVGIGIGGTFDSVAHLAKQAILKGIDYKNKDKNYLNLEQKLYEKLEKLKIGAMGRKGKKFLLGVNICQKPCHIASLPLAVNLQCHSFRLAKGSI